MTDAPRALLVSLSLAVFLAGLITARAALPPGWSDTDIGAPAHAGAATQTNGGWTVSGGGADIWGTSDQFNFVSQGVLCDGAMIAKVTSVQNSDPGSGYSKAGLMLRNDTNAGSMNAYVTVTAGQGVTFQYRSSTGGSSVNTVVGGVAAPVWLKLLRAGDLFSGFYSTDGTNWTPIGAATIEMNGTSLSGLAVTAHNNAALNTATFTNVALPLAAFGVYREMWTNLNSTLANTLDMLTNTANNPNWPANPVAASTHIFANFETEINTGMNYFGQRVRAFIVPPVSGAYTFWIASDDASELFLGIGENPASIVPIAGVSAWTGSEEWSKLFGQQSAAITLQAGCRYYLEAQMQQGSGGVNLAVRWQLPNGVFEQPLTAVSPAGTFLIPFRGVDNVPGIFSQSTNVSVVETLNASFFVLVTNQAPVGYQWFTNGVKWAGATLPVCTVSNASLARNNGEVFTCVVTNSAGAITSAPVTLTVLPDTTPPMVAWMFNVGSTNVQIVFSESIALADATNTANYFFTNGLALTAAALGADNVTVTLTTAPLVYGSNYAVILNNLHDRASTPNPIAPQTQVSFTARPFVSLDLGAPPLPSTVAYSTNGISVGSDGAGFLGAGDQGNFQYQLQTGDFDLSVRVAGLSLYDVSATAGLMAREALDPAARYAAVFATPAMNGSFFVWRDPAAAASVSSGSFPANYPNTWLRLSRAGNLFTGYASYDGLTWTVLGSDAIAMPAQIYLGLADAGRTTNQLTTAQFQDLASTPASAVVGVIVNPHEPLGPSARKTSISISEIMYKPAPRTDGNNCEFLEIYNSNPYFQDIGGYQIVADAMSYTFPAGTIIPGGAFFVVAASPSSMASVYGLTTNVFGPYSGSLKKAGTIQLLNEHGAVLLTVPYANTRPWPVAAAGTGHSIVLAYPTYGEGDGRAWDLSDTVGGSPGQMDAFHPSPLRSVVINEILAHSENPGVPEFVELYNHNNQTNDLSGCILTDDASTNKFLIPAGALIGPGGFLSFNQTQMGFVPSGQGGTIFLIKSDGSRILDAFQYEPQADGVSFGRWPDGADDYYPLTARTPGTNNSSILIRDVVINELMYNPVSGNDDDQYLELYNKSTNTISLAGWQLTSGVTFTFPPNVNLASNAYLVVARNLTNLLARYPNLNISNTVGNFGGKLSHNGERVALAMPQSLYGTGTVFVVEDEVTYSTDGRWGQWSAGGGSSLELIDPRANHRLAANWADSDDTAKSVWTNIEYTGVLDNGSNYGSSIDLAQFGLLDVGECLVDNIEVNWGGTNYVPNGTFESGLANWSLQGCLVQSSLENSGYLSSQSLHVRCTDRMWTGVNSCQVALNANSMAAGNTVTLRFKARWLHGWPEALLRLHGNWLEATGALPIPANLGTPGQPNSRAVPNAGPAIYAVTHTPSLPAANQPAVVTARIHDPNGVRDFYLAYRLDPATAYSLVPMKDDGTGGDALAGDGVWSGTIPGQAANQIAAFFLTATDSNSASTRFPAVLTDNTPVRECLVMFGDGDPGGSFGVYHLWVSQTNVTRWANLSDLSNEAHDATFVNGTRVIYDAQGRFSGSPYHQGFDTPAGNLCHYKWIFPDDDKFLGATSFNKIHQPGNGPGDDTSIQREQLANVFLRTLGVPWLSRRYVVVYVNGNRRGTLMEDTQVPDGDFVKEWYPNDTDGYLYKMQPWFEFAPQPSGSSLAFANQAWVNIMPYTTTGGVKKIARYRYSFESRRTPDSASDFTNVFSIVDAATASASPDYVANMGNLADMENWMRVFAANHAAGNWDSYGAQNGQNLYGYVGALGTRYSLLMWDFNIVFGNSGSWGPGQNLFSINSADANTIAIFNNPTFGRMYWRALQELANGPLNIAQSGPLLDAKFNAFAANGLSVENPNTNIKPWLSQAASSIASQLAAVNATSFTVLSATVSNGVATLAGVAPVNIASVLINGAQYPLRWTTLTNWTATIPLQPGTNQLAVTGVDRNGAAITGATNSQSLVYNGSIPSPAGQIVINEILCNPAIPGAEYVELLNNSTNATFDLSEWQFRGLSYTFPPGSMLGPKRLLVLAASRAAFAAAYGATVPLFDTFAGTLSSSGHLTLLAPVAGSTNFMTVTELAYDSAPPWAASGGAMPSSLQLVDPTRDNWRVGNWAVVRTNDTPNPQWVRATATGTASTSLLYIYLTAAGDMYLDDVKLVAGSVAEAGANLLPDGDFESGFPGPWTVSANHSGSALSTNLAHSGSASLHLVASSGGTTQSSSIWQIISPRLTTNATYTISCWYLQNTNGTPLTIRLSGSGIVDSFTPTAPALVSSFTPAATNSIQTSLPAFPTLWINEVQADNLTGLTNAAGQRAPWLELYNPATNPVSLSGLYLANQYTNLKAWTFPTNAVVNPGQFKVVFADGLTNLSTTNELHAGFTLTSRSGSVALSRFYNGQAQVLDYVNYSNIGLDNSYGSFPDGQSFVRQQFYHPTPGGTNDATGTPPPSFVPYTVEGAVYAQTFDALPNPGLTSVNTANPVTINGVIYALSNPFDFAYPVGANGGTGGLGLTALTGWYGLADPTASIGTRFGATDGDQTTGGQLSFGLPNSGNRALGLLATSTTGYTAFGLKLVNGTGVSLNYINLQITGEVWRQSNIPKTLVFRYLIDPTASAAFSISATAYLPALNVAFPTVSPDVGGVAVDGTSPANQASLSVLNQVITNWPPGAALWLVWEMPDATGKAQGLGLDNLSFSATSQANLSSTPLSARLTNSNFVLTWPAPPGQSYQLQFKNDLNEPNWTPLGASLPGASNLTLTVTNAVTNTQRFYRLQVTPPN